MRQNTTGSGGATATVSRRLSRLRYAGLAAVIAVVAGLAVASMTTGSRDVSWEDIIAGMSGSLDNVSQGAVQTRLPRTVLAILVGAALGLSGAVMQGVTRNPLADPGILGVNMGASLAIVASIAWVGISTASGYIWTAIAGAAVTAVFVYIIGSLGRGGATPLKLALAGAATSAALASFITAISLPRADISATLRSWQIGGVGGANFDTIAMVLPFLVVGMLLSLLSGRALNSLALGDDLAAGLGERVALARGVAALGAVILAGAATALAGPIGFMGLVVPHFFRLLLGVDYRWLLPFSAMGGATLLLVADIGGRVVARPIEIDVGIITALIGAPVFIAIVRRQQVREL